MVKSASKAKRIGMLGGTFNPVHIGHLYLASKAMAALKLSKVIFIPTHTPPHKKVAANISPLRRIEMLRIALKRFKAFNLCLYEVKRKGKSFSIRTVKYLRKKYGKQAKMYYIVGADMLRGLKSWKKSDELFSIVTFVVSPRPHYAIREFPGSAIILNVPAKDVSSSQVRNLAKKGKSLQGLVPPGVERYICMKKMYLKA